MAIRHLKKFQSLPALLDHASMLAPSVPSYGASTVKAFFQAQHKDGILNRDRVQWYGFMVVVHGIYCSTRSGRAARTLLIYLLSGYFREKTF